MKLDLGYINKVAVVHIVVNGERPVYHFLTLKKAKDEVDFMKQGENFRELDELIKAMSNRLPVLLHFSGKGILNRQVAYQENYQHSILLNGNMNAFYFTDFIAGKKVFSSVIRKDAVAEVLGGFEAKKMQVIGISSGPFIAAIIGQVLGKNSIDSAGFKLAFEAGNLIDFKRIPEADGKGETYDLGGAKIPNNLLPCAALGALFFNPDENVNYPDCPEVFEIGKEEAKQKNIFTRFGMGMMLFFLLVLFGNHLYLGHLNETFAINQVYLDANNDMINLIAKLEDEKGRKEKLLQSSGLLSRNFLSYYLMELGNSVPGEINFDNIVVRPLQEEIKPRHKIAFEEHLIQVSGRSKTSHVLSRWIERIEASEWLEKVDILSYEYENNDGVFELEMIVL